MIRSRHHHHSAFLIIAILAAALFAPMGATRARASQGASSDSNITGFSYAHGSALYQSEFGSIGCREPGVVETTEMSVRDTGQEMRPINAVRTNSTSGLTIVLRATLAVEQNSEAKAAFLRAAAQWESLITTQITVVVDVDFGPTWFGQPYPDGVVGLTNTQMLSARGGYLNFLEHLLDRASTQEELGLYYNLPLPVVPTDQGDMNTVIGPSAVFRAVGLIDATATPGAEPVIWGPPPAIGLNSSIDYDFDSSDGVEPGKTDFESVAAHELGHVLGFESAVGQLEVNPDCEPAVSVWDLFRVRPGATIGNFSTAQRILSSGGAQVFFNGTEQLQLSTGRPDQTGDDGQMPSHWRDDSLAGVRIGVMDPTIEPGRRQATTLKDLQALDLMGYRLRAIGDSSPSIGELTADLNGDILSLNVFGSDPDGDVVQARLTMLDQKNHVLGETAAFGVDAGVPVQVVLTISASGMGQTPGAMHVGLTLIDSHGNTSKMVIADFTGGDKGGPVIKSVSYKKGTLHIKGKRFGNAPEIEINSLIVSSPSSSPASVSNKKLTVEASAASLNIRTGPNRVRVISNGLRSNLVNLTQ